MAVSPFFLSVCMSWEHGGPGGVGGWDRFAMRLFQPCAGASPPRMWEGKPRDDSLCLPISTAGRGH